MINTQHSNKKGAAGRKPSGFARTGITEITISIVIPDGLRRTALRRSHE